MKSIFKKSIAVFLILIIMISSLGVAVQALSVKVSSSNYGYMVPTDKKFNKVISKVHLYGDYDYLNFYANPKSYNNITFFYEIYSDKKLTNCIANGCLEDVDDEAKWSPLIKLKGKFKSQTYYCVTYSAAIRNNGVIKVSEPSIILFEIVVDRSVKDIKKQIVVLKSTSNTLEGPKITWSKLPMTVSYFEIYRRKPDSTKYKKIATVSGSEFSYVDNSINKDKTAKYVYTVRGFDKKGNASRYLYSGIIAQFVAAPKVSSVTTVSDNEIRISWNHTIAHGYKVYRSENGGPWKNIGNTCSLSFYDADVTSGNTYKYTVKATYTYSYSGCYADSYSSYYKDGPSINYAAAPKVSKIEPVDNGLSVQWNKVDGAVGYTVLRKVLGSDDRFSEIASVSGSETSYIDETAQKDVSYKYTIRSEVVGGSGSYKKTGYRYIDLGMPDNFKAVIRGTKLTLSWDPVNIATAYEIYKVTDDGELKFLKTTEKLKYTITPKTKGELKFCVRAVFKDSVQGEFSEILKCDYYPEIECFSYETRTDSIYISWKANIDAEKYNVYKAVADDKGFLGEYELVKEFVHSENGEKLEYTDYETEDKVKYRYVVKGVYNGVEQTNFKEVIFKRLPNTEVNKVKAVSFVTYGAPANSVEIKFNEKTTSFLVYGYDFKNQQWVLLQCERENTTVKIPYYWLPSPNDEGNYKISVVYETGYGKTTLDTNVFEGSFFEKDRVSGLVANTTSNGVKLTWNAVEGVEKYILKYRNQDTGEWVSCEIIEDGSATYSRLIPVNVMVTDDIGIGVEIKAVKGNSYIKTDVSILLAGIPELDVENNVDGYVYLYWKCPVFNNKTYYLYRKVQGEDSWTRIKASSSFNSKKINGESYNYYIDKSVESGVKYTYMIRARGEHIDISATSYYDKDGVSIIALSAPKLVSLKKGSTGVTVKWEAVVGAEGYYVYRKAVGGKYTKIAEIENGTKVSFKDKTAEDGVTYYYTVKAYSGNSTSDVRPGLKLK